MTHSRLLIVFLVALGAAAILALPVPVGTGPKVLPALALTVFTVSLWATGSVPEHRAAVAFFILALGFDIAPASVIFSGFRSSAFWLVFGGVIIGVAADRTGLGRVMAHGFVRRLSGSYVQLIAGIVIGAVALAFLIPAAIARLIILMPIVLGLADSLGLKPGSKGRIGMVLATTLGSFYIPMTILPANLPNMVLAGVADSLFDIKMTYGTYLLMHFPITGAIKACLMVAIISVMFRDKIQTGGSLDEDPPRLGSDGRRMAVIVAITLTAWITDFMHGISPGWVAIAAALVCVLPRVGVIGPADFKKNTSFQTLLFVVAVLALGTVVANSGAGALIADWILAATRFSPNDIFYDYAVFSGMSILFGMFATLPGAIAVLAPFAGEVAQASGVPLFTVLMMLVNGFSTVFFPYQSAPIMIGIRLGGVTMKDALFVTVTLSLMTITMLLPLNYFWWRWLGYFP